MMLMVWHWWWQRQRQRRFYEEHIIDLNWIIEKEREEGVIDYDDQALS